MWVLPTEVFRIMTGHAGEALVQITLLAIKNAMHNRFGVVIDDPLAGAAKVSEGAIISAIHE